MCTEANANNSSIVNNLFENDLLLVDLLKTNLIPRIDGIVGAYYVESANGNINILLDVEEAALKSGSKKELRDLGVTLVYTASVRLFESIVGLPDFLNIPVDIALLTVFGLAAHSSYKELMKYKSPRKQKKNEVESLKFFMNIVLQAASKEDTRKAIALIPRITVEDKPELEELLENQHRLPDIITQKAVQDWRFEVIKEQVKLD